MKRPYTNLLDTYYQLKHIDRDFTMKIIIKQKLITHKTQIYLIRSLRLSKFSFKYLLLPSRWVTAAPPRHPRFCNERFCLLIGPNTAPATRMVKFQQFQGSFPRKWSTDHSHEKNVRHKQALDKSTFDLTFNMPIYFYVMYSYCSGGNIRNNKRQVYSVNKLNFFT